MKRFLVMIWIVCAAVCLATGCAGDPLEEGVELLQEAKYEEAAERFEDAAEKEKDAAEAYRGIGIAKWELADYEGAKEAFQQALDLGVQPTATLYNFLGNCELALQNPVAALNHYRMGIALEDADGELMREMKFNEIAAYEGIGDWESAKVKLSEYMEDYPDDERAVKEAEFLKTR